MTKTSQLERRFLVTSLRSKKVDGKPTSLEGYAANYNCFSDNLGGFKEKIAPGAFARAIKEKQDVRALFNHNPDVVFGRTTAGTLELSEDKTGLHFSCNMPETQAARDLLTSVDRGDINQCSFGFRATEEKWEDSTEEDKGQGIFQIRTLNDCDLFDVSPVTYPAYTQTSCSVRDLWPDGIPSNVEQRMTTRAEAKTDDIDVMAKDKDADPLASLEQAARLTYLTSLSL